ncbi:hypothetical protein ACQKPT_16435 [Pseudomonas monteilii]|uniref:hypothetical protein n=1 Tax=Pseudomonas monteilii TaxID=76759 RepID=UPI003D06AC0C
MIPVVLAEEPKNFDEKVRKPGLLAIAEMVGESGLPARKGPKRAVIAARREDIPSDKFPSFWTEALPELRTAYRHVCGYMSFYIEPITGAASVDHMLAKSACWNEVYEWKNYRLACSLMNSRKKDYVDVLDPFEVGAEWFHIELVGYQVIARADLDPAVKAQVDATIKRLKLNDSDCLVLREAYANDYFEGEITFGYLSRRAPFLAHELERQGKVR